VILHNDSMNYALRQEAKAQSLIPILCEVTQNYEIHEFIRLYLRSISPEILFYAA
jgi:hypothetical protein